MTAKLPITLTLTALLAFSTASFAETAQQKGLSIAITADKRDTGFGDVTARLKMVLRNKQGDESTRDIRLKTLEVEGDGDKSLSIFDHPADVKGTAFLTHSHALKADDQWLYLPALKRIKRINSKNKSGPFMGSEFAYEDLSSQEVEKYKYKYLGDETLNGIDCFMVEQYPQYAHSGYKRLIVWVNKQEYRPEKIVFYDRKNALLKTLTYDGYNQYLGQFWRADRFEMVNHQTGKSTTLTWTEYKFGNGLKSRDFHKNSLKRTR